MPKRALIDHRPWLVAGIALAIAFWVFDERALGGVFRMALKGGSVAALGAYALARTPDPAARMIAAVMFVGAAGDIGMELSTVAGGALFLLAHVIAITLYLRNRRARPTIPQVIAAIALLVGMPLAAWVLSHQLLATVYACALGAMAATAWTSRFSRYSVGVGALLFAASDLFIFARFGGVLSENITGWFVWPLYYAGQFMIATGVVRSARSDHRA